ncbi:MAG: type II secretion system secretin GspD [Sulfurovaceae bacterium]
MRYFRFLVVLVFIYGAPSFCEESITKDEVSIDLRNLNIQDFIAMVSKITNKNILIDASINGKINFITTKPISKKALLPLADSILRDKGLTLIDQGDYFKVTKIQKAPQEGLNVNTDMHDIDTMQTVMFSLKHNDAGELRAKIAPLLSNDTKILNFASGNILSVTASPQVLESVSAMIDNLESQPQKQIDFVTLKHTNVTDVYQNILQITKGLFPQKLESEKVNVFADKGSNSIILVGKERSNQQIIRHIKTMDMDDDKAGKKMYVIPLVHSSVEDVEKILSPLLSQMNDLNQVTQINENGTTTSSAGGKAQPTVVSDVERNSLVVLATPMQYKNIKQTIDAIDQPKTQVYVQAKIVEINSNLAKQLGIKYGFEGGKITSNGLFSLASNMGASSLIMSDTLLGFLNNETTQYDTSGNLVTTTAKPFRFDSDVAEVFALGAKLDILEQDGAAHILSEPSILCTNNKEAEIYVGQTQSILTQAQQSTQGQANIINNYSREDIGITLKVKPRVSSSNKVALDVETQIEDVLPSSGATSDRPTTTKRKVTTNAIVNNGETIILGGLIKNATGKTTTKVPILGDIPILGELFTHRENVTSDINVVIYLTPYIVESSDDLTKLKQVLADLEEIQIKYNHFVRRGLEEISKDNQTLSKEEKQHDSVKENNGPNKALFDILDSKNSSVSKRF